MMMYYKNSKEDKNYKSIRQEADNAYVEKPRIEEPVERTVNGVKWSNLDFKTRIMNSGNKRNGYQQEQGLEIVSPEFDLLTGLRGITNLPKGFLKGNGKIPIEKTKYYRQVNKLDKGIERAKKIGVIDTKPPTSASKPVKVKGVQLTRKTNFDVPFFSRDNLWYGRDPKYDVIVGDVKDFNWMPITKHGGFRPEMIDDIEAHVRATPLVDGVANKAATSKFEYYRNYPIIGMRNVTEGFPTIPITGLNTTTEAVNKKALGGKPFDMETKMYAREVIKKTEPGSKVPFTIEDKPIRDRVITDYLDSYAYPENINTNIKELFNNNMKELINKTYTTKKPPIGRQNR